MKTRNLVHLLAFVCCVALFASCKKSDEKEPETPTLTSKDPQAVSAAVKVWHGERLQGAAPVSRGTGLALDAVSSAPITYAFSGRYAIINPEVNEGEVAGYYLQFTGAKEHFKIDYSKPRGGRLAKNKITSPFRTSRQAKAMDGNADSAIVIALPANLQVPDTFCVTYCAYDVQGNISNPITTCIVVNSLGTTQAGSFLNGVWHNTAYSDSLTFQTADTVIYNKWVAEPFHSGYVCRFDSSTNTSFLDYNTNGGPSLVTDSVLHLKSHLTFGNNGGMGYEFSEKWKYVDIMTSTCSQFVFEQYNDQYNFTGAWSYNPATGKMILVFEFDDNGLPALEAWEYTLVKINDNNILLMDNTFGSPSYIRFEK